MSSKLIKTEVIIGIKVNDREFISKIPDPLYGKCKYNPDTGAKVEEYITNRISIVDLCDKYNLSYSEEYGVLDRYYVIGIIKCSSINYGGFLEPASLEISEEQYMTIFKAMIELNKEVTADDIKLYVNIITI